MQIVIIKLMGRPVIFHRKKIPEVSLMVMCQALGLALALVHFVRIIHQAGHFKSPVSPLKQSVYLEQELCNKML